MSTRLIQVVPFVNVAPAATVALPHNINVNGVQKRPDYVAADVPGFTIVVTPTQVSVTNTNAAPTSVNVWLELKHTIPRELGSLPNLTPQPFVAASGAAGGSPTIMIEDEGVAIPGNPFTTLNFAGAGVAVADAGGGTADITVPGAADPAVIFDDAIPANEVNIRSNRASNQSPIDNTKAGITNLGNATGVWTPSTGVQDNYSTISGGDDNSIVPGDGYNVIGGGAGHSVEGGNSGINSGSESTISGPGGYANVISGGDFNQITGGLYAAAIAGGGSNFIDVNGDQSFIGGGNGCIVNGVQSGVVGGDNNNIQNDLGFIGGGGDNTIQGFAGVICGGGSNNIFPDDDFSAIVGGDNNGIGTNGGDADNCFIGAGRQNHVNADFSSIVGGANSSINPDNTGAGTHSFIGGGEGHEINDGNYNAIAGGQRGEIRGNHCAIGGGVDNLIDGGSNYSAILGGNNNTITDADYASISGGRDNLVTEDYGHARGYNAQATSFYAHAQGAYVTAWGEGMQSFASADDNFPPTNGRWQMDDLVGRFGTANAPVGANQHFRFGQTYSNITLPDNKAYAIRARMAAGGRSGGVGVGTECVNIVQEMIVRKVAGVVTVVAQAQQSAVGTATATANWTVIGVASGADLFIDFSTGADATTTNIAATAHLEIVEVPLF